MFPLPLLVTVQPSRRLRRWLAALHLAAGTALWLADLPTAWQGAGTALLALDMLRNRRPGETVTLRCKKEGALEILADGEWQPAHLAPDSLVLPGLTVLRYQTQGQRRFKTLVLLGDSLPGEDFRRLRVWLRWLGVNTVQPNPLELDS